MKMPPLLIHASVAAAVVLGIGGMGTVYNAVSTGNLRELSIGWALLMIGLWWAGRYLAISMAVHRAKKAAGSPPGVSEPGSQLTAHGSELTHR
jgi:hypothetical protein